MKIQEFAESRNLKVNTVHVYLNKHKEILEDCFRDGKYLCIKEDSKGFELLCKKYPLPQPVNVIEDTESRKKLIVAQEMIIKLQQELSEARIKIEGVKYKEYLLEAETNRADKAENELLTEKEKIEEIEKINKELNEEIDKLKNRSFWSRVFNK